MLTPGDQLGPYRIQKFLASGGAGAVYQAQAIQDQREVVIKVISHGNDQTVPQKVVDDFRQEAKMMAKLKHERILPLLSDDQGALYDANKGVPYIVMPYCQEKDLNSWLRKDARQPGWLPLQGVAHFVHQAAEALQHIHDNRIVHRDVKPANFLVQSQKEDSNSPYPDICLADFGIARLTTTDMTAIVIGTRKYMAPEQWENKPEHIGPHTDQYALGIMTYELLTGHCPFKGNNTMDLKRQHCKEFPQLPSTQRGDILTDIDKVILRALEKDPQKRFPSVSEFDQAFQKAVRDCMQTQPVLFPDTPLPIPDSFFRRWPSFLAQVAITTLLVLLLISALTWSPWRGSLFNLTQLKPALSTPVPTPTICPGSKGGKGVIKLAVDLPLSGKDMHSGQAALQGVELAIKNNCVIENLGYALELEPFPQNDVGQNNVRDPKVGVGNIQTLIGDAQVAGIIGPLDSDVAMEEIPVAAKDGSIALISPSNASDCLTINPCGGSSSQPLLNDAKHTYFRTAALNSELGDRLANYLFNTQHYRTASIFEERPNVYGQGIAQSFFNAWQELGGKVVSGGSIKVPPRATSADYKTKLQPLVDKHPDVVFFGGGEFGATLLHAVMNQYKDLAKTPFASTGAIVNEASTKYLKSSSAGPVYAIASVGDPSQAINGLDFINSYYHSYSTNLYPYSSSGYDCANILLQAIKNALATGVKPPLDKDDQAAAKKFRQKVIDEIHSSSFSYAGVTGVYSFNGNADPTNPSVSIYQLGDTISPVGLTHQFSDNRWQSMQMETRGKDGWQLNYPSN